MEDIQNMGIFGESNLELNLGFNPEELAGDNPPAGLDNKDKGGANPLDNNIDQDIEDNTNEDGNPEDVVGKEGDGDGSDDAVNTSPNLHSSFAAELHKEGVLPSLDLDKHKIENTSDLINVIRAQINTQVKDVLVEKLGEEGYDAIEKGVSLAQYQQYTQRLENYNQITDEVIESNVELAKQVILEDYINQGLSENRARKILQKTIDDGDDAVIADAKESINSLKIFEANRLEAEKQANIQRQQALQAQQEKIDNDLKNSIYNTKEIIKGVPINKTIQDQVYQSITKVVGEHEGVMENKLMRDRRENPISFDTKLYYFYEITNGFTDFSKITKSASSKTVSDFERALRQAKFEDGGSPTFVNDKDSYDGIGSELVIN